MQYQLGPPPMNPLSRLVAAIVGALALVGAFFFGFFILLAALAMGLLAWAAIWLRVWWIRRKLAASGQAPPGFGGKHHDRPGTPPRPGDVIDGDYEVVSRDEDKE